MFCPVCWEVPETRLAANDAASSPVGGRAAVSAPRRGRCAWTAAPWCRPPNRPGGA